MSKTKQFEILKNSKYESTILEWRNDEITRKNSINQEIVSKEDHKKWLSNQLSKNETPAYEVLSGAAIAFAALLLIIPGFATDVIGFLLIFPFSRKIIFEKFSKKFPSKKQEKNNFIDGEFEDIEDDNDKKI